MSALDSSNCDDLLWNHLEELEDTDQLVHLLPFT